MEGKQRHTSWRKIDSLATLPGVSNMCKHSHILAMSENTWISSTGQHDNLVDNTYSYVCQPTTADAHGALDALSEDDAKGSTFLLPFFMWKQFENGLVKRLRLDLNDPSLPVQTRDEQISRLVLYFQTHTGRNMLYGKHFIYCIFFNFLNVMAQIYFTNLFLGGIFFMYGTNFSYGHSGVNEASSFEDIAFPKMSRCVLHVFGPSGTKQIIDALCVLPLNILHDKVYLVLWYWYGVLVLITLCNLIYWLIHYFFKQCRQSHIQRHLKGKTKGNELKPFNQNFGDWLVLHQVYKNIEHRHFTRLVSEMCKVESNGLRRSDTMIFDESKDSEDNDLEKDPLKRTEKKVVFQ
ncbi:innexin inx2-like isoform X3 [Tigriopus californicus]|uniref:innexin inx2-like isoform X3 n=1 Tax=Tigriopus californicus TaxID=6832 RepID=UPI0027DA3A57|nr:innexin inx2-like isoform X3 [Tigriopus californicus]